MHRNRRFYHDLLHARPHSSVGLPTLYADREDGRHGAGTRDPLRRISFTCTRGLLSLLGSVSVPDRAAATTAQLRFLVAAAPVMPPSVSDSSEESRAPRSCEGVRATAGCRCCCVSSRARGRAGPAAAGPPDCSRKQCMPAEALQAIDGQLGRRSEAPSLGRHVVPGTDSAGRQSAGATARWRA
eukprot:178030-Chlamydomonas_euryale.AAC.1